MKPNIERARELRRAMTDAETILWSRIRHRRLGGLKCKRQVPIGGYIVDFLIEEAKLIIELDGEQHGYDRNAAYDAERDSFLRREGYEVLRFWNEEVYKNLGYVMDRILLVAVERMKNLEMADPSPETASRFRPLPRER